MPSHSEYPAIYTQKNILQQQPFKSGKGFKDLISTALFCC